MSEPQGPDQERKLFKTNAITYTKMGLFGIFAWVLWGDFIFTLMEEVKPQILPLFLLEGLKIDPSSTLWINSIIPQIIGFIVCPIVSFKSDRCRSKWGRRIPYMIFTAPALSLFLGALGFSGEIVEWMRLSSIPAKLHLSPMTTSLLVIGFLGAGYSFFDEFVNSVYWYLFNDVVPKQYMGRFLGLFRMVGTGASMLFSFFVFPYALSHTKWIFIGFAIIYLLGFSWMCLRVKEGPYPPVTDVTEKTSIFRQFVIFFRDCLGHPIYILLFISQGFGQIRNTAMIANTVFLLHLGISLVMLGQVGGWTKFINIFVQYPCGWIVDKFHPLRVTLIMTALGVILTFLQFFFLLDFKTYLIFTGGFLVVNNIASAAGIPLLMRLLPQEKYGQFCSANGAMRSLAVIIAGPVAGIFLNWAAGSGSYKEGYRLAYLWSGCLGVASLAALYGVYLYWRKMGADKYVPPLKEVPAEPPAEGQ